MKLDRNGVTIEDVVLVDTSVLGPEYIVMWDSDGMPMHVHKDVIQSLYNALVVNPKPVPAPPNHGTFDEIDFGSVFLDGNHVE